MLVQRTTRTLSRESLTLRNVRHADEKGNENIGMGRYEMGGWKIEISPLKSAERLQTPVGCPPR